MNRLKAVVNRVIQELIRDKRTLALMLIAPIVVLTLMHFVFDAKDETKVAIGFSETVPSVITEAFPLDQVKIKIYSEKIDGKTAITDERLDVFIQLKDEKLLVTYKNEDPSNTLKVKTLLSSILTEIKMKEMADALQQFTKETGSSVALPDYTIEDFYVYGTANSTFFDKIFPVLIGFFVFFFVFLISGIALLKERTSGTLERLLATPIKRWEIVLGYLIGYGLFAIIQTVTIVLYSLLILDLQIAGNLGWVILTNIFVALVALSMGIFVSTFAHSEFQMIQFIPLIVVPQVFFSGIIPLETMAPWIKVFASVFPIRYAGNALTAIVVKGQGFSAIWSDLVILFLFIVVFTFLNILGLKRYRDV